MDQRTSAILVVAAGTLVAVLLLVAFYWISRRALSAVFKAPVLKRYGQAADSIARNLRIFLLVIGFLLCLGIAGANAYLVYTERDPLRFLLDQAQRFHRRLLVVAGSHGVFRSSAWRRSPRSPCGWSAAGSTTPASGAKPTKASRPTTRASIISSS